MHCFRTIHLTLVPRRGRERGATAPRKRGLEVAAVIQSQILQDLESSEAL